MKLPEKICVHRDGAPIYDIVCSDSFESLPHHLLDLGYTASTKIMIVTDSHVEPLYLAEVTDVLCRVFPVVSSVAIPAGEADKNLDTVSDIYDALIRSHYDRTDLLLALGGGVVGDITGFAAATYLRGVDFVQVPTTLLAMVDSSVGGKTGVDFKGYKNMVGAFHMPRLVYMNLRALTSLPDREIACGMGEVIKYGISMDADFYEFLFTCFDAVTERQIDTMGRIVHRCCDLKRDVVEEDPTEKGRRRILNFGHTIGHAIEKLMDFELLHGECVALGMAAAAFAALQRDAISVYDYDRLMFLLNSYHLPVFVAGTPFDAEDVYDAMLSDKKTVGGRVSFIMLSGIGASYVEENLTKEELLAAIGTVVQP